MEMSIMCNVDVHIYIFLILSEDLDMIRDRFNKRIKEFVLIVLLVRTLINTFQSVLALSPYSTMRLFFICVGN